ncbi:MAG: hypothetical protein ABIN61_05570 [candidate division WOR-3 bacterium]
MKLLTEAQTDGPILIRVPGCPMYTRCNTMYAPPDKVGEYERKTSCKYGRILKFWQSLEIEIHWKANGNDVFIRMNVPDLMEELMKKHKICWPQTLVVVLIQGKNYYEYSQFPR